MFLTPALLRSVSSPRSDCPSEMCAWSWESPLFRGLGALWGSRPTSRCPFFFCCAVQLVGSPFPSRELNLGPGQSEIAVLTTGWRGEFPHCTSYFALSWSLPPSVVAELFLGPLLGQFCPCFPLWPPHTHIDSLQCLCGHRWLSYAFLLVQLSSCTSLLESDPRLPACLGSPQEGVLSAWCFTGLRPVRPPSVPAALASGLS